MSTPRNPSATEIGRGQEEKLFHHRAADCPRRDVGDIGETMLLAVEIAEGDARRASLVSLDELRALATLAACASVVAGAAAALFAGSDAGAAPAELKQRMRDLAEATRPFMGNIQ